MFWTQNCCATKQKWTEIAKQKCVRNKKVVFLSSPDTQEILPRRSARNLRASQFMGPRDSTAVGWNMYWSSSMLYFATLRVMVQKCHPSSTNRKLLLELYVPYLCVFNLLIISLRSHRTLSLAWAIQKNTVMSIWYLTSGKQKRRYRGYWKSSKESNKVSNIT